MPWRRRHTETRAVASRGRCDTPHVSTSKSSAARAARAGELASAVFLAELLELLTAEHSIGDGCYLFGLLPRALELEQLTRERAPLRVLVGRHLEREPIDQRET